MKFIITAPSLDMSKNVSGISALVSPLLRYYPEFYIHLQVGSEDRKKGISERLTSTLKSAIDLLKIRFSRSAIFGLHLNTALDTKSVLRDLLLASIARMIGIRLIVHIHGGYWMTSENCPAAGIFLCKLLARLGEKVIVLGVDEIAILATKFGITNNIMHLHNYAAPDFFEDKNYHRKITYQILFAGRLVASKRVHLLPELMKSVLVKIPNATLLICGDGPLKSSLLEQMNTLPEHSWKYEGVVVGEEKVKCFFESDLFLLPSSSGEGMPVSLLEALAAGCIPIVTHLGAIPSVVKHTINGYIVDANDFSAIVDSVINALTSNDREAIRSNAIYSSKEYTIDSYFNKLLQVYSVTFELDSRSLSNRLQAMRDKHQALPLEDIY